LQHKLKRERDKYKSMYGEKLVPPGGYTDDDLKILRESFQKNERPDHSEKLRLSIEVGRPITSIDDWFKFARKLKENSGDDENKNKKFTSNETEEMESIFSENKYPNAVITKPLAIKFNREEQSVREWFKRRRLRYQKDHNIKLKPIYRYSEEDLQFLRDEFARNPHPTKYERVEIGKMIGRSETGIYRHFAIFRAEVRNKSSSETTKTPKWATTKLTNEEKEILEELFVKHKLSVQESPDSITYPKEDILKIEEETEGLTVKRIKEWIQMKRRQERKKLGLTKSTPRYKPHEIKEMEAHLPNDYPPDKNAYKDFANRFGRTDTAIAGWFSQKKSGIKQSLSQKEISKIKLEREKENNKTLEYHFNLNLFPSDAELREIAEAADSSFYRVKKMQHNHMLMFKKKIGEEEFQKRIDAGNFTVFDDDES